MIVLIVNFPSQWVSDLTREGGDPGEVSQRATPFISLLGSWTLNTPSSGFLNSDQELSADIYHQSGLSVRSSIVV